jgi:hypothetical protein
VSHGSSYFVPETSARVEPSTLRTKRKTIAEADGSVVDSWTSNYWLVLVVKAGLVVVFYLTAFVIVRRKEDIQPAWPSPCGRIQSARVWVRRCGPVAAGRVRMSEGT